MLPNETRGSSNRRCFVGWALFGLILACVALVLLVPSPERSDGPFVLAPQSFGLGHQQAAPKEAHGAASAGSPSGNDADPHPGTPDRSLALPATQVHPTGSTWRLKGAGHG
jgi:hypothetical protein